MGKYGGLEMLKDQWADIPVTTADLAGKVVMVLGPTSGIGLEAARHFARMNPKKLILACRNEAKGKRVAEDIRKTTGYEYLVVSIVDLADFSSISRFVEEFEKSGERLDIVIQNAALAPPMGTNTAQRTKDGWELTVQANVISPIFLSILLLPSLFRTARTYHTTPRIVFVSSSVHYWATIAKDQLDQPNPLRVYDSDENWEQGGRYQETKLLCLLLVRALNERLTDRSPVIVTNVCPGYCLSSLRDGFRGIWAVIDRIREMLLAITSEVGSRKLLWAALASPEPIDDLRGAYIRTTKISEPSDWVLSQDGKQAQDKLWNNLIGDLSLIEPRLDGIVKEYLYN